MLYQAFAWIICFVSVIVSLLPATLYADTNIQGIWSSLERTKGGLGSQWVFTKDGNVAFTFGALVDFNYVIKDNTISMTSVTSETNSSTNTTVHNFSLQNDRLEIEGIADNQVMKRVSTIIPGKHPIIGDWSYTHNTGGTAVMRYRDNGIAQFSLPFETRAGIYFVDKNIISISITGKKPFKGKIHFEENKITFTRDGSGKLEKYIKLNP